jgi:DNA repair protein RecN (Recombination protein N)
MLVSLRIKNLALVDDLSIEFGEGFNAISGETGAGKSILIAALSLVLGDRADRDWIRTGADSCTVEAVFNIASVPSLSELLLNLGVEECQEDQLLLKRVFTNAGSNRQFANGSPTTIQGLKQIGEFLVDFHGPHEHQSLLKTEAQLRILDRFASLEKQRGEFSKSLRQLREIEEQKKALVMDEAEFQRQLDLLSHQVNEIEATRLKSDEDVEMEADYTLATNGQKLLDLVNRALDVLSEGDSPVTTTLSQAHKALRDLAAIDPRAAPLEESNVSLTSQLQELIRELSQYASKIEVDPDRLNFLNERMTLIQGLKRKYGKTLAEVIEFGKTAQEKLKQLQGREEQLSKLDSEFKSVRACMEKVALTLRAARQKAIPKLAQVVTKHLSDLGFAKSHFTAQLSTTEPNLLGMDAIEFRFAPNIGEPEKPLREIASSGEMARVMLALKTSLADQDEIPVLIFDEVDANVGGEVGNSVGEKMAHIGKRHQVLCITHLPQVAAYGATHFMVAKTVEKGRTVTQIQELGTEKRVQEIARMLGGKGDTAVKHAKEMLKMKLQAPSREPRGKAKPVAA